MKVTLCLRPNLQCIENIEDEEGKEHQDARCGLFPEDETFCRKTGPDSSKSQHSRKKWETVLDEKGLKRHKLKSKVTTSIRSSFKKVTENNHERRFGTIGDFEAGADC